MVQEPANLFICKANWLFATTLQVNYRLGLVHREVHERAAVAFSGASAKGKLTTAASFPWARTRTPFNSVFPSERLTYEVIRLSLEGLRLTLHGGGQAWGLLADSCGMRP